MSGRKWTDDDKQFVINNYANMTCRQIGEKLGRSESSVVL